MRYIRTKDGKIVDTVLWIDQPFTLYKPKSRDYVDKENIIKQADTIYELCDYAIIKLRFLNLPDVIKLEEMNRKGKLHNPPAKYIDNLKFLMTDKRAEYIIFAIWNGKKLVNVAEMNQEGEIKLL